MRYYYNPDVGLLLAPNKCASSWLDTQLEHLLIDNANRRYIRSLVLQERVPVYMTVRDPVQWYVSGYRFALRHNLNGPQENYSYAYTFDEHLQRCVIRKILAESEHHPLAYNLTDSHTWVSPYQQMLLALDLARPRFPIKYLKIEERTRLYSTIERFKGSEVDKNLINSSTGEMPRLHHDTIALIRWLDNWSHHVGYNTNESINNYINTLCE